MKNLLKIFCLGGTLAIFLLLPLGGHAIDCTSNGDVYIFCKLPGGTCTNNLLPQEQKNNANAYCTQFQAQFVGCTASASDNPGVCALQVPGCCSVAQGGRIVSCSDTVAQNCNTAVVGTIFWANQNCSTLDSCGGKTQAATPTGCCKRTDACTDNITQQDCSNSFTGASWVQDATCGQGCQAAASTSGGGSSGGVKQVETNFTPIKPVLQINIPTVNFSDIKVQGETGSRYVDIPYLAEYITGVFNYALGFLAMLAVIILMIGGMQYILARGDPGKIGSAKKMMGNAIFGMILGLSSYLILNAVSPSLTNLSTLRTPYIERVTANVDYPPPPEEPSSPADDGSSPPPGGKVPFFGQFVPPWSEVRPAGGGNEDTTGKCQTIRARGCGTTSFAMVLKFYGKNVTPKEHWALGIKLRKPSSRRLATAAIP